MNRLVLSAVAALSIAGFALPALADASSVDETQGFSAAEFFAEQGNRPAQQAYDVRTNGLSDNAISLVRKAPVNKSVTPAGADSLTHSDAEYSW
jgi:hypothetical protein